MTLQGMALNLVMRSRAMHNTPVWGLTKPHGLKLPRSSPTHHNMLQHQVTTQLWLNYGTK